MKCNVCGTIDNKDGRGPVKAPAAINEGICKFCREWNLEIIKAWFAQRLAVLAPARLKTGR